MKITVVGLGYVGTSLAVLLSTKHEVIALDINKRKIDLINARKAPFKDAAISDFLKEETLNLKGTLNKEEAYVDSDFIIIAVPTNYDEALGKFDLSTLTSVINDAVKFSKEEAVIIIKSTVPIGFTASLKEIYKDRTIIFSPEFLRENKALHDNLYPSRIIVGDKSKAAETFAALLVDISLDKDVPVLYTDATEAEAIKLYANSYLAMRVAFFNELDTYAELYNLNTKDVIQGVSLDPRIGDFYNNPSFGYGGYCLPKDVRQMISNYKGIDETLFSATHAANEKRKDFIAEQIIKQKPEVVGVYRLLMKKGASNTRSSSIEGIISRLVKAKIKVILYEPNIKESTFKEVPVISNLSDFKKKSSLIICNRYHQELDDVKTKVYTRDAFRRD